MNDRYKLVRGLYFDKPHEKQPDFVRGNLSFNVEKLQKFVEDNKKVISEKGWMKVQLLKSKEGSEIPYYFQLDTDTSWKSGGEPKVKQEEISDSDIPF